VKDNLDIEKLFKDKFKNFEGDVNPQMWQNISQGISSQGAVNTGMTIGVKALIASAVVVTISVATYYVGGFNQTQVNKKVAEIVELNEIKDTDNKTEKTQTSVIVTDDNDPVINEHKEEIIESLSEHTVVYNDVTESTVLVEQNNLELDNSSSETETSVTTETVESVTENVVNHSSNDKGSHQNDVVEKEESEIIYPTGKIEFNVAQNIFEYSFNANSNHTIQINWDFGDGQFSTDENPVHIYSKKGEYTVTLTLISKDNEIYQESKLIEIKSSSSIDNIPNVITPNGDRINDKFVIQTTDIETFSIVINDQFGNKIFESKDSNFSWDGTDLSGNMVEKTVYIYYILATGTDGSIFKIPGQIYVR